MTVLKVRYTTARHQTAPYPTPAGVGVCNNFGLGTSSPCYQVTPMPRKDEHSGSCSPDPIPRSLELTTATCQGGAFVQVADMKLISL